MAIKMREFETWDGKADEYIREHFAGRDMARAIKVKRLVIKKEFVGQESNGDIYYRHHHKGETIMSIKKAYTIEVYT